MVGMGMRDDRPLDRLPGIDVEVSRGAEEAIVICME
jgi:hypothetical protein